MKKTTFLSVLFFFLLLNLYPQDQLVRYKLDNGFTVILQPDATYHKVFGLVVANVGAKHDPPDATGLAHYMEHMLFKGTQEIGTIDWESEKPHLERIIELYDKLAGTDDAEERRNIQSGINEESVKASEYAIPNELWNILMEMGGTGLNAGTGEDITLYFNTFPPSEIKKWLEVYSHRFIEPVFRGFQAELEVVYEEKNMYSDMFIFNLFETFSSNLFRNHPYGQQSIIGSIDHLKNPSLSSMIKFYNTWYVANNMALILVGNFDSESIIPVIDEKFSRLQPGDLPEQPLFEEPEFNGREFFSGRYSPIRLGVLGFRTVPKLHPDYLTLEVANGILTNTNSSGLLDRLMLENELMAAAAFPMPYHDHGAALFLFIPKILGQSLGKAENLILEQIHNLRTGNFDESMVEALKLEKYREFHKSLEDYAERGLLFADAFVSGKNIEEIYDYPNRILSITKQDIIEVAARYYGDNYLAFYSRMGSPGKEKIEKPGYEPLVSNVDERSEYVKELDQMESLPLDYAPIDFENDVKRMEIVPGTKLFYTPNPVNDIFSLTVRYMTGNTDNPLYKHVATALNYAGAGDMGTVEFKTAFANTGCTYSLSSDDSYFNIRITGKEENLPAAMELINELMQNTHVGKTALRKITEEERLIRRVERSEPQSVANALFEYVRYGDSSTYLLRPQMRDLRRLDEQNILDLLRVIKGTELEFHYSGTMDHQELAGLINSNYTVQEGLAKGTSPSVKELQNYDEPFIFFVNERKALQSNIWFFMNGGAYNIENQAVINAYNTYFGGDFSGIVLQEIREYRSLSYAASANYRTPPLPGKETHFIGYVGTQADKTIEAIEVYSDVLFNMPQKPERIDLIRNYLLLSAQTSRPGFRDLSFSIERMRNLGYENDPYLNLKKSYETLRFEDIVKFQEQAIKNRPLVIAIVGDERSIDMEALRRFGKIVPVSKKDLYNR